MKEKLINIFKKAEGKQFTYISLISSKGIQIHSCIEKLIIDGISDGSIFFRDEVINWDANVVLPLLNIAEIIKRKKKNFDIDIAEAEYDITYFDGSELLI